MLYLWFSLATNLDITLEDIFYSQATGHWLIEKDMFWPRLFFYNGIKDGIIAFGIVLILALGYSYYNKEFPLNRRHTLFLIASLAIIPALAAFTKRLTGIPCPYQLTRYGGLYPYAGMLDFHFPDGTERPACFPAGHPSGGFALLALACISGKKWRYFLFAFTAGVVMSLYQIMRGAHFLSHCVTTFFLAMFILEWLQLFFFHKKTIACE